MFESAESKNISIQLKGKSKFLINGFDFLSTDHSSSNVTIMGQSSSATASIILLQDQLNNVKKLIKGVNGIVERLERLESSTIDNPRANGTRGPPGGRGGPPDRVRINQLNRRVATLEQRLGNMTERLLHDNCRSFPCQNGGTCFNMFDSFRCECPENWEGPTCGQDTNECGRFAGTDLGCQNGATCINQQGTYEYDSLEFNIQFFFSSLPSINNIFLFKDVFVQQDGKVYIVIGILLIVFPNLKVKYVAKEYVYRQKIKT